MDATSLREYMERHGVAGRVDVFAEPVETVQAAAKVAGVSSEQIVKSLVVMDEADKPYVCLVRGDRRLDLQRARRALGVQKLRLADAEEIQHATGYAAGAVPPLAHRRRLRTVMDQEVQSLDTMVAGGGSPRALVRVSPRDVLRLTHAVVAEISSH